MKNDFIAFDLNSDGNVDASEVRKEFKGLSQKDISGFFIAADTNEDGLIDFEEYRNASLAHESGDLSIEDYTYQWRTYDT